MGTVLLSPLVALLGADPADPVLWEICRQYMEIILLGIPLFFASYLLNYFLRNDDQEKLASFGFTVGNLSDIVLNIVLVLYFDFGATGAAWSTLAGQAISLCVYLVGMDRWENHLRLFPLHPALTGVWDCFRVGFASFAQYLFTMLFLFMSNHALLRTAGSVGVAVVDMLQNASFLILYLYEAAAKAAQPLLSTFQGKHNPTGQRRTLRLALGWGTAVGGAAICVVAVWPGLVCGLFGLDGEASVVLGCYALQVYCLAAAFAGINVILESGCQARGHERGAFLLATLRDVVFPLPLIPLFLTLDANAYWWLYPISEAGTLLVFLAAKRLWERADSAAGVDMDAMGVLVIRQKAKEFFYRRYQGFNSLVVRI